jgi:hypothetical protein
MNRLISWRVLLVILFFLLYESGLTLFQVPLGDGTKALCFESIFPVDAGYMSLVPHRMIWAQQDAILLGDKAWALFPSYAWLILGFLVAISGAARWQTWLRAISFVGLLTWLVLPVIITFCPELATRTDLPERSFYVLLVVIISYAIYYCVVPMLWPEAQKSGQASMSMDVIAPEKGLTVRQILLGLDFEPRRFLFGKADKELVAHWGMIGRAIVALAKSRKQRALTFAVSLFCWPVLIGLVGWLMGGSFERDVDKMWATTTTADGQVVATTSAIHAAERVFMDDIEFRGLTREEALKLLHIEKMNPKYKLNVPPNSWTGERMLLRISDGNQSAMLMVGINEANKIVLSWLESDGGRINPFAKALRKEPSNTSTSQSEPNE